MWIEVASCLEPELKRTIIDALFSPSNSIEENVNSKTKSVDRILVHHGVTIVRAGALTEYDAELQLKIQPRVTHRLVKAALYARLGERISFHEFGRHAEKIIDRTDLITLRQIHETLTWNPLKVPSEEKSLTQIRHDQAETDLYVFREELFAKIPKVTPPVTAREIAIDTYTTEAFVRDVFSMPEFAVWLTIPKINIDLVYEEALHRGMQRFRNEIMEAPIWEGSEGNVFNTKNARIVLDAVKFLDERKRQNINLHLHQHQRGDTKAVGGMPQLKEAGRPVGLPQIHELGSMSLDELEAVEASIDSKRGGNKNSK